MRAAQLPVGIHQLGNHGYLQLVQVGLRRLLIGVGGFQVALDAAKQIDFPGHVQTEVITVVIDPLVTLTRRYLTLAQIGTGTAGDGRHGVVADVIADRPRRFQAGEGDTQLTVASQGLSHQLVEGRIVELLPPETFEVGTIEVLLASAAIGSGGDICRRRVRRFVVRADGTGAQCQYQQAG